MNGFKKVIVTGVIAITASASIARENGTRQLAQTKHCMSCHAVDKKLIGPSFKDIAKRWRQQDNEEAQAVVQSRLVTAVLEGSAGQWGAVPMPANKKKVTKEEATQLVQWILLTE